MPIYEYQGKSYDIATDDPAEARRKIQSYLEVNEPGAVRSFGRSAASTADVALNAVTGTLDVLARPLARAYYGGVRGMTGDELEQRITAETTSPKDVIGRSLGITETPQYQGEAARRGTQYLGEAIEQNVINPVAEATGLTPGYVSDVVNIGGMAAAPGVARVGGPAVRRTAQAVEDTAAAAGRAAVAPVRAGAQVAEGLFGGVTGRIARPGETPGPLQTPSSRIPLGQTYIDPSDWARFQRGEITVDQLQSRPIQEFPRGPLDRAALAMAGNEVPAAGQGMRAFGEALGRQYRRNPLTSAIDIGVGALGLPPPVATYRVGQGLADYYLSRRGFDPNLPAALSAAQGQAGVNMMRQQAANQPPRLTYNPSPTQPVTPGPIYVAPEGVAGTNINQVSQAGAQQKYAPQSVAPQNIQAQVEAAAAQRVEQMPVRTPEQQAILEQIRARGAAQRQAQLSQRASTVMGENYQAPTAGPVAPLMTLEQRRASLADQPVNRLFEQEQPVAPVAPTEIKPFTAVDEQPRTALDDYNDWKRDPAGFIRRQGRGPGNTLGMVVPEGRTLTTRSMPDAMVDAMSSPEAGPASAILVGGKGTHSFTHKGIEYRVERIDTGEVRIQARKDGAVIDEYYIR